MLNRRRRQMTVEVRKSGWSRTLDFLNYLKTYFFLKKKIFLYLFFMIFSISFIF